MKVNFQKARKCDGCNGIGGKESRVCPTCGGQGHIRNQKQERNMFFVNASPCYDCGTRGSVIIERCKKCEGSAILVYNDSMIIEIKEKK